MEWDYNVFETADEMHKVIAENSTDNELGNIFSFKNIGEELFKGLSFNDLSNGCQIINNNFWDKDINLKKSNSIEEIRKAFFQ